MYLTAAESFFRVDRNRGAGRIRRREQRATDRTDRCCATTGDCDAAGGVSSADRP